MNTTAKKNKVDDYLELVKKFSLRPIRTKSQYLHAMRVMGELVGLEGLTHGEEAYLEALSFFVRDYESNHVKFEAAKMKPVEALKYLMQENEMSVTDLGKIVGTYSLASMILHGKREISKSNAKALAARFAVEPGMFI